MRAAKPGSIAALAAVVCVAAALLATDPAEAVTAAQVQEAFRDALNSRLHPESLTVNVVPFESGNWTEKGRFKAIVAEATNADVDDLKVDSIRAKLFDVTLDLDALLTYHRVKVISAQNNTFSGKVSEAAINRFLAKRNEKMKVKNLKIKFKGIKVEAVGTYKLAGLGSRIKILGYFQVKGGRHVNFHVERAWVNGIPLPAGQVRGLMDRMNPVLDLRKMMLQPNLRNVAIEDETYILLAS